MKAVIQRVRKASVEVDGHVVGRINRGLVVFLGIAQEDDHTDVGFLVRKLTGLRIFSDDDGKMNQSLQDIGGALLVISQFTLLADTDRGRRPSFEQAAPPHQAQPLYQSCIDQLRDQGFLVETGLFGAKMMVLLENDGPVTLVLDTPKGHKVKKS